MKEQKIKKHKSILKTMRTLLEIPLHKITYHNFKQIHGIHDMEDGKTRPRESTVISISNSLGIKPDILLYSFGHLPPTEREIISSDPFYYSEKIQDMCNNHEHRYEGQSIGDIDLLNIKRCANYIETNRVGRKKKPKVRKENEEDK